MSNHLYDNLIAQHSDLTATFIARDNLPDMSFEQFLAMTARMAHVLQATGLSPGDCVVVQAGKSVEMLGLYAATIQAGGVYLPLNVAYTQSEMAYFVGDATPTIIVCDPGSVATLKEAAASVGASLLTLGADGKGTLTDALDNHPAVFNTVSREPEDLAALLYTSGTTGRSKGAMLTHDNLLSNALALVDHWQISASDRLLHALPIFHTHGLFVAVNTSLAASAAIHFMPSFDLDAIVAAMPDATMLMGVPTFYTRMLADERLNHELTAGMRVFISGSAPLLAETHADFTKRTGHYILERYGMTETNMVTSNPYTGERRAGTVGMPLKGVEVRLCDADSGATLSNGELGSIEVRGPNVFKGYWQMPEKTAAEFRDDGFFITGDLGQFSSDGYLSIVGRAKDLIITGGYNVYPKEIEDVLNDIEGVNETAVFGIPHADFGEAIVAAVVLEPAGSTDTQRFADVVAEKLARFKHPRRYEVVDALPRNAMGKVQKNVLRDRYG